jgi:hypothetical protein
MHSICFESLHFSHLASTQQIYMQGRSTVTYEYYCVPRGHSWSKNNGKNKIYKLCLVVLQNACYFDAEVDIETANPKLLYDNTTYLCLLIDDRGNLHEGTCILFTLTNTVSQFSIPSRFKDYIQGFDDPFIEISYLYWLYHTCVP